MSLASHYSSTAVTTWLAKSSIPGCRARYDLDACQSTSLISAASRRSGRTPQGTACANVWTRHDGAALEENIAGFHLRFALSISAPDLARNHDRVIDRLSPMHHRVPARAASCASAWPRPTMLQTPSPVGDLSQPCRWNSTTRITVPRFRRRRAGPATVMDPPSLGLSAGADSVFQISVTPKVGNPEVS